MSCKSLFMSLQSRWLRELAVNHGSKLLFVCSTRTYAQDRSRITGYEHKSAQDEYGVHKRTQQQYGVAYGLNLPSLESFSSLVKDSTTEKKIKIILMEHAMARMSGGKVPKSLSIVDMDELLQCSTACERLDVLDFFYMREARRNLLKLKQSIEGKTDWEKNRKFLQHSYVSSDHIRYASYHNTLHMHLDHSLLQIFYNCRLAQAACFGQPLVFDFGYDQFMTRRQCSDTAQSIFQAYIENRHSREPFDLYFSNFVPSHSDYSVVREAEKHLNFRYGPHTMVTASDKSYLDLFPNKNCVYLTPHAEEDMQFFDSEAVYIIGAFLTLESSIPMPLIKAKQDGIRTLRIPVEKYSRHYPRRRSQLNFPVMMKALLEMKLCSFEDSMRKVLKNSSDYDMNDEKVFQSKIKYRDNRYKFLIKDYW